MKYNYRLSVLTPVHIGDGTSYTKKEYYITNGNLGDKKVKLINRVNLNKYIQSLSSEEQDKILFEIKKYDFKLPNIKQFKLYHSVEEFSNKSESDEKHPTTIESTIKDNKLQSYIPGSSIKGSIKTAIMYDLLEKENVSTKKDYEKVCNFNNDKINLNISISDSSSAKYIKTVQPLSITLKGKNEKAKNDDSKKSAMYNALECIPQKNNLNFNIQTNENNINHIKECLYYFNYDYIDHELEFYSKIGTNKNLIKIYNQLKNLNTKESPLIRIGGSTGLLSTTIGLHMKLNNPDEYKKVYIKDVKKYNEEFPKIRKITPQQIPFGWCKLKTI